MFYKTSLLYDNSVAMCSKTFDHGVTILSVYTPDIPSNVQKAFTPCPSNINVAAKVIFCMSRLIFIFQIIVTNLGAENFVPYFYYSLSCVLLYYACCCYIRVSVVVQRRECFKSLTEFIYHMVLIF